VDSLLFPVKLGPELQDVSQEFETTPLGETPCRPVKTRLGFGVLAGLALGLCGCGYQPVYGAPTARYEVTAGRYGTASFEAVQEAVAGVRSELGAAQALGSGYPQVIVEVVRVDERSTGVHATGSTPLARGSEIVVVGRARVLNALNAAPTVDTGDMSRSAAFAAGSSPTADAAARSRALRDASRSLGRALGRAVLGLPEPLEG
jgi:hypothetical protein